ncbi:MAG: hypothetical protein C7B46_11055 [Sulfobacillus benefaciens]|uniref:SAF domain-containing protein n=1 Tax=Sulfobacillus benefaciens TaxID=453960 RepID=A0A2T2XFC8_9FIRM|nr:MAG: hypothetical protein C7B46_11055 [Sulfobacillus benefaciens]
MAVPFKIPRSGAIAMIVAGSLYAALSMPHLFVHTVQLPVATRYVSPGESLQPSDFTMATVAAKPLNVAPGQVLKNALVPGQVITNALLGVSRHVSGVLVAVTPSNAADIAVASPGSVVSIIVISNSGETWHSSAVPVVSASAGNNILGTQANAVLLRLPMSQAEKFLQMSTHAQVFLVGVGR